MGDVCNDERHRSWALLLKAQARVVEVLDHELQTEKNLPLTWFDVLVQLASNEEGRLPMHELADRVLLSKSGVTRLVDRMERAGLLERAPCPTDRRVIYATITDKGRDVFGDASPVAYRGVREHFTELLTASEKEAFESGLTKIIEAQTPLPARERAAG
ncbi:MAG: MarR family transcriptional regulator [Actinobacteria bacterium]|nr:MarR family transcriptional regulator [Actinomycetota bacterium]